MLYNRHRPSKFEQVIGQDHVVKPIESAIQKGSYPHAFLFYGERGCGKTTIARIIARYLNCQELVEKIPCGRCPACLAIDKGNFTDLIEIDAASNRGVEHIRQLRERVYYQSTFSVKVVIIDECHMLTREASNALLKTLEEPPKDTIFCLCTTEPEKLLPTIKSRSQQHALKLVSVDLVSEHLKKICEVEGWQIDDSILYLVANEGRGSVRDAITILESLSEVENLTQEKALEIFGKSYSLVESLVEGLIIKNSKKCFEVLQEVAEFSKIETFTEDVEVWLQTLLNLSVGVSMFHPRIEVLETQKDKVTVDQIIKILDKVSYWNNRFPIKILNLQTAIVDALLVPQPTEVKEEKAEISIPRQTFSSPNDFLTKLKQKANGTPVVKEEEPKEKEEVKPDYTAGEF